MQEFNTLTVLGAIETIIKAPVAHSKPIRGKGIRSSIKTPLHATNSAGVWLKPAETVSAAELQEVNMLIFAG